MFSLTHNMALTTARWRRARPSAEQTEASILQPGVMDTCGNRAMVSACCVDSSSTSRPDHARRYSLHKQKLHLRCQAV